MRRSVAEKNEQQFNMSHVKSDKIPANASKGID